MPGVTELIARVVTTGPNALVTVELENGQRVQAHVALAVRATLGRLLPGDRVRVELSPYDHTRGRITRRQPL